MLLSLALAACGGDDEHPSDRGLGLDAADIPAESRAAAYAQALGGVFDLGPGLVLLADPVKLPRSRTAEGSDSVAPDVLAALQRRRAIQGTCAPRRGDPKSAPICDAEQAGYIVRVSDPFDAPGDTIQLFVTAERYRPSIDTTGFQPPLFIEQRYELVPRGAGWTVARKARLVR